MFKNVISHVLYVSSCHIARIARFRISYRTYCTFQAGHCHVSVCELAIVVSYSHTSSFIALVSSVFQGADSPVSPR